MFYVDPEDRRRLSWFLIKMIRDEVITVLNGEKRLVLNAHANPSKPLGILWGWGKNCNIRRTLSGVGGQLGSAVLWTCHGGSTHERSFWVIRTSSKQSKLQ